MRKLFAERIENGRPIHREIWEKNDGRWEVRDYLISSGKSGEEVRTFFKATSGRPEKLFHLDALGNPIDFGKIF